MNSTTYGVDEYGNEAADVRSGYVGEFKKFGFSGVPKHCLACDGSEISRATYSELFEVFGETYGAGDGETTFNLPDFRGAFFRCIGGKAAELGVQQGDAIRNCEGAVHNVTALALKNSVAPTGVFKNTNYGADVYSNNGNEPRQLTTIYFSFNGITPVANENRPLNYAVNVCVVYE